MKRLIYICNALDDSTRIERGILTDSPAASRKIFLLCKAMKNAGVRAVVISLGRGRQNGTGRYFGSTVRRVNGIAVIYLPFFHFPVFSELLSLVVLVPMFFHLRFAKGIRVAIFYNRMPFYLAGLTIARAFNIKTVLDLEDGTVKVTGWSLRSIKSRLLTEYFDFLCSGGALLACSALEGNTRLRPTLCCYGTCESGEVTIGEKNFPITVLFGGTVSSDTGANILISAIKILRERSPEWANRVQFEITGKGDCIAHFQNLAEDINFPKVVVHGRTTDEEYQRLLGRTQIGLALKPNCGELANTTFPSKVIELASYGILVLTTDISDVRKVFGANVVYLTRDDPQLLIEQLQWILENRAEANIMALSGKHSVETLCSLKRVGQELDLFLFERKQR